MSAGCPLCSAPGGDAHTLVWRNPQMYLVQVQDDRLPCFFRLVLADHVAEMSDLDGARRGHLWHALHVVEQTMRRHFCPDKVNLASLGNQVPHVHWHLLGRWRDDAYFPDPVWAPVRREPAGAQLQQRRAAIAAALPAFQTEVAAALGPG